MFRCASCLLLVAALTGCGSSYKTSMYNDPFYKQEKVDYEKLADKGERYNRRGDYIIDVSEMGPRPDESYAHFRQRLFNTLAMQEYEQSQLNRQIEETTARVDDLQGQLVAIREESAEMRLALAELPAVEEVEEPMATQVRFRYHVVQPGETLQTIAFRNYGSHKGWLALYRFNRTRLPDGPNRVEKGTVLFLPSMERLPFTHRAEDA